MPVEIIVPSPSFQIPPASSRPSAISLDLSLRRGNNPEAMPRRSSGTSGELDSRGELFKKLAWYCELWIACGHEIGNQDFMTAMAEAFVQLPGEKDNGHDIIGQGFGNQFFKRHSALEMRRQEAKRARRENPEKYWLSQLEDEIFGKFEFRFTPSCVFSAIDFGFITEVSSASNAWTCQRPRSFDRQPHNLTSATLLISMTGQFFPFQAMMKVPRAAPTKHKVSFAIKVATNQDGWATKHDKVDWLIDHFHEQTKGNVSQPGAWRLLFIDTYSSGISKRFFLEGLERQILCVSYPKPPKLDLFDPFRCGGICAELTRSFRNWISRRLDAARDNGEIQVILRLQVFAGLITEICFKRQQMHERTTATKQAWKKTAMYHLLVRKCDACGTAPRRQERIAAPIAQPVTVKREEPQRQTSSRDNDADAAGYVVIDLLSSDNESSVDTPSSASSSPDSSQTSNSTDCTIGNSDGLRASSSRGRKRSRTQRTGTPSSRSPSRKSPVSARTRYRLQQNDSPRGESESPSPTNCRRRLSYGNRRNCQTPAPQPAPQPARQARPQTTVQRPPSPHGHLSSDDDDSDDSFEVVSPDRPQFSSVSRDNRSRYPELSSTLGLPPQTPRRLGNKILSAYENFMNTLEELPEDARDRAQRKALRSLLQTSSSTPGNRNR